VTVLDGPEDRAFPVELAARAIDEANRAGDPYRLLAITHCETSTGQLTDLRELLGMLPGERPLVMVDAISSVPGAPLDMSRDGVDLCVLASHKTLGAPIGLAVVAIRQHVLDQWDRRSESPRTWAFDLQRWLAFDAVDAARPYPVVLSTHLLRALHASLLEMGAESVEQRQRRQAAVAARARTALEAADLSIYGSDPSPTVTPVLLPNGVRASELSKMALESDAVHIVGGMGAVRERIVRIPHLALQAQSIWQRRAIAAVIRACGRLGAHVDETEALAAFDAFDNVAEPPAALEAQP